MTFRIGQGLDVHAFEGGEADPLMLGGVLVRNDGGLSGHSDADVAVHAVADALLGAAALGDLGSHFGVDRPELAGANSLKLLAEVVADVAVAGWTVGNVDLTIIAQRPRLSHLREEMRENLARVLEVEVGQVSVKFTTTDRLGAIGRAEGIAASAVATLLAD